MSWQPTRSPMKAMGQALAGLILVLLASTHAFAGGRQAQEKEARKACLNGDYAQGVSILSDLFVSTKNPTYIFNQGRCFEQNRKYEDAIARFEEYGRAAAKGEFKSKASDQDQVEKHIQKCKELLAEQESRSLTAPQAFVPPTAAVVSQPEPAAAPAPVVVQKKAPAVEERGGSGLLIGGIISATLGAGAIGAGVYLNLKANKKLDDMYEQNGYSSSSNSSRKTYTTLGWVAYGVGGAGLVTGAVLIFLGARGGSNRSSDVALLPTVGNGLAGLALTGGF